MFSCEISKEQAGRGITTSIKPFIISLLKIFDLTLFDSFKLYENNK